MEWENIILTGACLVAVAALAYYFWNKSKECTKNVTELNKRIEAIELMFAPQPSNRDLDNMFKTSRSGELYTYTAYDENTDTRQYDETAKIIDLGVDEPVERECKETNGCCLTPLVIKAKSPDIDKITNNLLNIISDNQPNK